MIFIFTDIYLVIFMMFFMLFAVCRMFYLPFSAGSFFIKTSDVGSIISSMDKIRLPQTVSIPVAVIFRFFPSFIEESHNIKLAMRVRGITFRNPVSYIEHVMVPLLVISSEILDDMTSKGTITCSIYETGFLKVIPLTLIASFIL